MRGVSVEVDSYGNPAFVNVVDPVSNAMTVYTIDRYESRGIQPDWHLLPKVVIKS